MSYDPNTNFANSYAFGSTFEEEPLVPQQTQGPDVTDFRSYFRDPKWYTAKPGERPVDAAFNSFMDNLEKSKDAKAKFKGLDGKTIESPIWNNDGTLNQAGKEYVQKARSAFNEANSRDDGGVYLNALKGQIENSEWGNALYETPLSDLSGPDPFPGMSDYLGEIAAVSDARTANWNDYVEFTNSQTKSEAAKLDVNNAEMKAAFEDRLLKQQYTPDQYDKDVALHKVGSEMRINPLQVANYELVQASIDENKELSAADKRILKMEHNERFNEIGRQLVEENAAADAGFWKGMVAGNFGLREDFLKFMEDPKAQFKDFYLANKDRFDKSQRGWMSEIGMKTALATIDMGAGLIALPGLALEKAGVSGAAEAFGKPSIDWATYGQAVEGGYDNYDLLNVAGVNISRADLTSLIGQVGSFVVTGGAGSLAAKGTGLAAKGITYAAGRAGTLGSIASKAVAAEAKFAGAQAAAGAAFRGLTFVDEAINLANKAATTSPRLAKLGKFTLDAITDKTAYLGAAQATSMSFGKGVNEYMAAGLTREQAVAKATNDGLANGLSAFIATSVMNRFGMGAERAFGFQGADAGILATMKNKVLSKEGKKAVTDLLEGLADKEARAGLVKSTMAAMDAESGKLGLKGWGILSGVASESVEETADQILSDVIGAALDDSKNWNDDVWANIGTKWTEYIKAGVLGAIGGGLGELHAPVFSPIETFAPERSEGAGSRLKRVKDAFAAFTVQPQEFGLRTVPMPGSVKPIMTVSEIMADPTISVTKKGQVLAAEAHKIAQNKASVTLASRTVDAAPPVETTDPGQSGRKAEATGSETISPQVEKPTESLPAGQETGAATTAPASTVAAKRGPLELDTEQKALADTMKAIGMEIPQGKAPRKGIQVKPVYDKTKQSFPTADKNGNPDGGRLVPLTIGSAGQFHAAEVTAKDGTKKIVSAAEAQTLLNGKGSTSKIVESFKAAAEENQTGKKGLYDEWTETVGSYEVDQQGKPASEEGDGTARAAEEERNRLAASDGGAESGGQREAVLSDQGLEQSPAEKGVEPSSAAASPQTKDDNGNQEEGRTEGNAQRQDADGQRQEEVLNKQDEVLPKEKASSYLAPFGGNAEVSETEPESLETGTKNVWFGSDGKLTKFFVSKAFLQRLHNQYAGKNATQVNISAAIMAELRLAYDNITASLGKIEVGEKLANFIKIRKTDTGETIEATGSLKALNHHELLDLHKKNPKLHASTPEAIAEQNKDAAQAAARMESETLVSLKDIESGKPDEAGGQWKVDDKKSGFYRYTPAKGKDLDLKFGNKLLVVDDMGPNGEVNSILVLHSYVGGEFRFLKYDMKTLEENLGVDTGKLQLGRRIEMQGFTDLKWDSTSLGNAGPEVFEKIGKAISGGALTYAEKVDVFKRLLKFIAPGVPVEDIVFEKGMKGDDFFFSEGSKIHVDIAKLFGHVMRPYAGMTDNSPVAHKLISLEVARHIGAMIGEETIHRAARDAFEQSEIEALYHAVIALPENHFLRNILVDTVKERFPGHSAELEAEDSISNIEKARFIVGHEFLRKVVQLRLTGETSEGASLESQELAHALRSPKGVFAALSAMIRRYIRRMNAVLRTRRALGSLDPAQRRILDAVTNQMRQDGYNLDYDNVRQKLLQDQKTDFEAYSKSILEAINDRSVIHNEGIRMIKSLPDVYSVPNMSATEMLTTDEDGNLILRPEVEAHIKAHPKARIDLETIKKALVGLNKADDSEDALFNGQTSFRLAQRRVFMLRELAQSRLESLTFDPTLLMGGFARESKGDLVADVGINRGDLMISLMAAVNQQSEDVLAENRLLGALSDGRQEAQRKVQGELDGIYAVEFDTFSKLDTNTASGRKQVMAVARFNRLVTPESIEEMLQGDPEELIAKVDALHDQVIQLVMAQRMSGKPRQAFYPLLAADYGEEHAKARQEQLERLEAAERSVDDYNRMIAAVQNTDQVSITFKDDHYELKLNNKDGDTFGQPIESLLDLSPEESLALRNGKAVRRAKVENAHDQLVNYLQANNAYNKEVRALKQRAIGDVGVDVFSHGLALVDTRTGDFKDTTAAAKIAKATRRGEVPEANLPGEAFYTNTHTPENTLRLAHVSGETYARRAPKYSAVFKKLYKGKDYVTGQDTVNLPQAVIDQFDNDKRVKESTAAYIGRSLKETLMIAEASGLAGTEAERYANTGGFNLAITSDENDNRIRYEDFEDVADKYRALGKNISMIHKRMNDKGHKMSVEDIAGMLQAVEGLIPWVDQMRSLINGPGFMRRIQFGNESVQTLAGRVAVDLNPALDNIVDVNGQKSSYYQRYHYALVDLIGMMFTIHRDAEGNVSLTPKPSYKNSASAVTDFFESYTTFHNNDQVLSETGYSFKLLKEAVDQAGSTIHLAKRAMRQFTSKTWEKNVRDELSRMERDAAYIPENERLRELQTEGSDFRVFNNMSFVIGYYEKNNNYRLGPLLAKDITTTRPSYGDGTEPLIKTGKMVVDEVDPAAQVTDASTRDYDGGDPRSMRGLTAYEWMNWLAQSRESESDPNMRSTLAEKATRSKGNFDSRLNMWKTTYAMMLGSRLPDGGVSLDSAKDFRNKLLDMERNGRNENLGGVLRQAMVALFNDKFHGIPELDNRAASILINDFLEQHPEYKPSRVENIENPYSLFNEQVPSSKFDIEKFLLDVAEYRSQIDDRILRQEEAASKTQASYAFATVMQSLADRHAALAKNRMTVDEVDAQAGVEEVPRELTDFLKQIQPKIAADVSRSLVARLNDSPFAAAATPSAPILKNYVSTEDMLVIAQMLDKSITSMDKQSSVWDIRTIAGTQVSYISGNPLVSQVLQNPPQSYVDKQGNRIPRNTLIYSPDATEAKAAGIQDLSPRFFEGRDGAPNVIFAPQSQSEKREGQGDYLALAQGLMLQATEDPDMAIHIRNMADKIRLAMDNALVIEKASNDIRNSLEKEMGLLKGSPEFDLENPDIALQWKKTADQIKKGRDKDISAHALVVLESIPQSATWNESQKVKALKLISVHLQKIAPFYMSSYASAPAVVSNLRASEIPALTFDTDGGLASDISLIVRATTDPVFKPLFDIGHIGLDRRIDYGLPAEAKQGIIDGVRGIISNNAGQDIVLNGESLNWGNKDIADNQITEQLNQQLVAADEETSLDQDINVAEQDVLDESHRIAQERAQVDVDALDEESADDLEDKSAEAVMSVKGSPSALGISLEILSVQTGRSVQELREKYREEGFVLPSDIALENFYGGILASAKRRNADMTEEELERQYQQSRRLGRETLENAGVAPVFGSRRDQFDRKYAGLSRNLTIPRANGSTAFSSVMKHTNIAGQKASALARTEAFKSVVELMMESPISPITGFMNTAAERMAEDTGSKRKIKRASEHKAQVYVVLPMTEALLASFKEAYPRSAIGELYEMEMGLLNKMSDRLGELQVEEKALNDQLEKEKKSKSPSQLFQIRGKAMKKDEIRKHAEKLAAAYERNFLNKPGISGFDKLRAKNKIKAELEQLLASDDTKPSAMVPYLVDDATLQTENVRQQIKNSIAGFVRSLAMMSPSQVRNMTDDQFRFGVHYQNNLVSNPEFVRVMAALRNTWLSLDNMNRERGRAGLSPRMDAEYAKQVAKYNELADQANKIIEASANEAMSLSGIGKETGITPARVKKINEKGSPAKALFVDSKSVEAMIAENVRQTVGASATGIGNKTRRLSTSKLTGKTGEVRFDSFASMLKNLVLTKTLSDEKILNTIDDALSMQSDEEVEDSRLRSVDDLINDMTLLSAEVREEIIKNTTTQAQLAEIRNAEQKSKEIAKEIEELERTMYEQWGRKPERYKVDQKDSDEHLAKLGRVEIGRHIHMVKDHSMAPSRRHNGFATQNVQVPMAISVAAPNMVQAMGETDSSFKKRRDEWFNNEAERMQFAAMRNTLNLAMNAVLSDRVMEVYNMLKKSHVSATTFDPSLLIQEAHDVIELHDSIVNNMVNEFKSALPTKAENENDPNSKQVFDPSQLIEPTIKVLAYATDPKFGMSAYDMTEVAKEMSMIGDLPADQQADAIERLKNDKKSALRMIALNDDLQERQNVLGSVLKTEFGAVVLVPIDAREQLIKHHPRITKANVNRTLRDIALHSFPPNKVAGSESKGRQMMQFNTNWKNKPLRTKPEFTDLRDPDKQEYTLRVLEDIPEGERTRKRVADEYKKLLNDKMMTFLDTTMNLGKVGGRKADVTNIGDGKSTKAIMDFYGSLVERLVYALDTKEVADNPDVKNDILSQLSKIEQLIVKDLGDAGVSAVDSVMHDLNLHDTFAQVFALIEGPRIMERFDSGLVAIRTDGGMSASKLGMMKFFYHQDARIRARFARSLAAQEMAIELQALIEEGFDGNSGRERAKVNAQDRQIRISKAAEKVGNDSLNHAVGYVLAQLKGLNNGSQSSLFNSASNWEGSFVDGRRHLRALDQSQRNESKFFGPIADFFNMQHVDVLREAPVVEEIYEAMKRAGFGERLSKAGLIANDQVREELTAKAIQDLEQELKKLIKDDKTKEVEAYAGVLYEEFNDLHVATQLALALGSNNGANGRAEVEPTRKSISSVPMRRVYAVNPQFKNKSHHEGQYITDPEQILDLKGSPFFGGGHRFNDPVTDSATIRPISLNGLSVPSSMVEEAEYQLNVQPNYQIIRRIRALLNRWPWPIPRAAHPW
jgi:hypothetical protein